MAIGGLDAGAEAEKHESRQDIKEITLDLFVC
jgi:hypothetical protein